MKKSISVLVLMTIIGLFLFSSLGSMNTIELAGEKDFPPYIGDSIEI